uniref:Calponin-homology (CH) domain-containing protein n=1 Tax=Chlamydomonas euryale TaxID=1486919 RepID=A0A7R9YU19_9CHLO|mmetsp:Transcript_22485/g.66961  ORF Transcript_22485/g.66961 Transcript_22485/m.66961 type:complete len:476 (+) Transcript_22485:89-1516(+)
MSLPRELLKWTLSLDLSYPIKNPRRDLCNGFVFAEMLSRYYPGDVQMHSFENVTSNERKKSNWELLTKLFKRKRIPVEKALVDRVVAADGDAAVELLQTIYSFIQQSNADTAAVAHPANAGYSSYGACTSDSGAAHANGRDFIPQHQYQGQYVHGMSGGMGYAAASRADGYVQVMGAYDSGNGPGVYSPEMLAEIQGMQQQQLAQQRLYHVTAGQHGYAMPFVMGSAPDPAGPGMPYPSQHAAGSAAGGYAGPVAYSSATQNGMGYAAIAGGGGYAASQGYGAADGYAYAQESCAEAASHERPELKGIAYSRKPRAVDFQPYSAKDFQDKEYNIKQPGKAYWELGRLGADLESEELQSKRENQERIKEMAAKVREENLKRAAAAPPKPKAVKELSARDRALQFAKNVPKPEQKPQPASSAVQPKGKAGSSGSGGSYATKLSAAQPDAELNALEEQHRRDQEKVDEIRAQLARMLH